MDKYQKGDKKSCLPHNGNGFTESTINDKGMVESGVLNAHITDLLKDMKADPPTTAPPTVADPAGAYATNAATLRKNIKEEYCFYYKRYIYILHDILASAATMGPGSLPAVYIKKKENTEKLNSKLNQILQILQGLVNSRLNTLKSYYGENAGVNELNKQLDKTRDELVRHSELLKKNDLEKDAKTAMIEYSIEKNSSSRNLLAIYGFMNIVAAGLIFYLYRSAKTE